MNSEYIQKELKFIEDFLDNKLERRQQAIKNVVQLLLIAAVIIAWFLSVSCTTTSYAEYHPQTEDPSCFARYGASIGYCGR